MRNIENYIKNKVNPFECMSPEAKYWIGYIFADGHLVFNEATRAYQISLFSKDEAIMRRFQEFLGEKAKFYKRPTGICQVTYNSKPVTKWFMETFNIPQDKTLTLKDISMMVINPGQIIGLEEGKATFEKIKEEIPLNRIGKTEDIAKCAKWLIEDDYTTGQIINVNGGWFI